MAKQPTHNYKTPPELELWLRKLTLGYCYYVRTARNDYVGRVIETPGQYVVVLCEASWISESGRLHVFLRDGRAPNMEVEPILTPGGIISCLWIDWSPWPHALFTSAIP